MCRIALPLSLVTMLLSASPDAARAEGPGDLGRAFRAAPIPVPSHAPRRRPSDVPVLHAQVGVVFVNFDGAELWWGWDDSKTNRTQIFELVGVFEPYGNDATKRAAVMQAVAEDWAPYNVVVTDQRPEHGDYVMNMVGPTNPFGASVLGIAPVDCGDSQTHNNITFAFHSADDSYSATVTATTIGQEVAHSFGLEHVDEPSDIMNPFNAGVDAYFHDQCIPTVDEISCPDQHTAQCGVDSQQNAHRELLALFGPSAPDSSGPIVSVVTPTDGAHLEAGADFAIEAEAADANGVYEATLYLGDTVQGSDTTAPFAWSVANAPAGVYAWRVEAVDLFGNVGSSDVVTVQVRDSSVEDPPTRDTDAGSGDDSLDDGRPADAPDIDADPDGGTDDAGESLEEDVEPTYLARDDVLLCSTVPSRPRAKAPLFAALLLLRRSRRRR